ncbi:MAG TPA: hypothetical protein H9870_14490 [Candidatus Corynebacterium avicola]|uniref:C4-type zinc ribbon domain-containing protein n=1 Tax=Candidatus Corynebacterium avicola TaxID=2838527 RepID=A0A9D1RT72_9CORY|nr:hypothetical protein [Candidatus Corynebacterium avicola]
MSSAPEVLRELAEVDERVRHLTARRQSLSETEEVTARSTKVRTLRADLVGLRRRSDDLDTTVRRLNQDAERLRERRRQDIEGLRSVTDVERRRDLRHDLAVAERRLAEVEEAFTREERLLATFTGPAGATDTVAATAAELESAQAELDRAKEAEQAAAGDIDRQLEDLAEASTTLRDRLPQDVRTRYVAAERSTGTGAAQLVGSLCRSCFMTIDPQSLARITSTPKDQLVSCPECDTLLIREDT